MAGLLPPWLRGVSIGFSSKALREQWVANPSGGKPFFLSAPFLKVRYQSAHEKELEEMVETMLAFELRSRSEKHGPNIDVLTSAVLAPAIRSIPHDDLRAITKTILKAVIDAEGKTIADYPWNCNFVPLTFFTAMLDGADAKGGKGFVVPGTLPPKTASGRF